MMTPEHFALRLAQRAARRRARLVLRELQRGIPSLATIAATAAFWGLAGTAWAMANSFHGGATSRSVMIAAVARHLADAQWFNLAGLLLAITASAAYRIASARLEECEIELNLAVDQLPLALQALRYAPSSQGVNSFSPCTSVSRISRL